MVLLASKGQVMIVQQDNHNRANEEASLSPRAAGSSSEPLGVAMGSGAVFVPQVVANKKEIDGLPFADMPLTSGVVLAVVVDMAESTRTDCGLDQRVDKSESTNLYFLVVFFSYI